MLPISSGTQGPLYQAQQELLYLTPYPFPLPSLKPETLQRCSQEQGGAKLGGRVIHKAEELWNAVLDCSVTCDSPVLTLDSGSKLARGNLSSRHHPFLRHNVPAYFFCLLTKSLLEYKTILKASTKSDIHHPQYCFLIPLVFPDYVQDSDQYLLI